MNKKNLNIINILIIIIYLLFFAFAFKINTIICVLLFVFTLINTKLVLITHELGHLLFGKMLGFKLISISFCGFNYNSYQKKCNFHSNENNCLMKPSINSSKKDFCIYILGGIIINFLLALVYILILYLVKNELAKSYFLNGTIIGIINLINNIVPIKDNEFLSDSDIIWYIHKDVKQLKLLEKQLIIIDSLEKTNKIGEYEYIDLDNIKHENMLTFFCRYVNYYLAIQKNELSNAYGLIQELYRLKDNYRRYERNQILIELLFISSYLYKENIASEIIKQVDHSLYDENSFDYIRAMYVYKKNIKCVSDSENRYYYIYMNYNISNANEYIHIMNALLNRMPKQN